ncbi:MAG TPA: hypothetical protein VGQ75_01175 [Thermoanaerobaculia bacterium]|nr:hypothetical protein [Thermoanaerobaculia bacterium]
MTQLFVRVAALAILLLYVGVPAAAQSSSAPEPGECAINRIDGVFAVGGFVEMTGFAFDSADGAPVEKIQFTLDRSILGEATLSGLRPDVLAHFARPDYLWSGWSAKVSLEGARPGVHSVEAVAITKSEKLIPCGSRRVDVSAAPPGPEKPAWRIASTILIETGLLLLWLAFVGLAPSLLFGGSLLRAPFFGLALFAIAAEFGSLFRARPFTSALVLTAVSVTGLALSGRVRRVFRRPASSSLALLGVAVLFAVVGVVPFSVHGEGAVLGDIDDAIRESAVADSIRMYRWNPPPEVVGYLAAMPGETRRLHMRPGGPYLLAALAQASDERAHAVHASVMLGSGVLVILGAGLLASRVLRRWPGRAWIPAGLVAVNSTILTVLAGQHLGSLLFAALLLPFLHDLRVMMHSPRRARAVPAALLFAAAWTYYPEGIATWIIAAALALLLAGFSRWKRTATRLLSVVVLSVALNPVGLVRGLRSLAAISRSTYLTSSYLRETAGDTHYFPSLNVVTGIEAYREDGPAPLGHVRSLLVPATTGLILLVSVIGWTALSRQEKKTVVLLLLPIALALFANRRLNFPYGFAKYLPVAVPLWGVVFTLLALRAAESAKVRASRILAPVALISVAVLSLPPARHVLNRAIRSIPAYDPAFRVLPALAATVERRTVIQVDEPIRPRLEWTRYFLGENRVNATPPGPSGGDRFFRLVDLRRLGGRAPKGALSSTREFALVPIPSEQVRP